ncbi:hypothetical protein NHX12_030428 [Muraenolepis orangiensis]|uniref:Uncharacterized protein n=1 Tax=Muraenolepis orangiensis TaxID=630683 RepID=A0A9Q0IL09_9TELE|nr:hypothetical protein NHX12_030428 [Muraenolepis orangiensis]
MVEENVLQVLKEKADFDSYKPRPFNMREFYDRTGHDIKDMLLACRYRGSECSAEDFTVAVGGGGGGGWGGGTYSARPDLRNWFNLCDPIVSATLKK